MSGQQVTTRPRDLVAEVCTTVASAQFADKVRQALPDGVSVERFTRVALTAIQQNPDLVSADRQSLYNSVVRCAQDGLMPDGQEAALVIYNVKVGDQWVKKVQHQPMVKGIIKRFGEAGIQAYAASVHKNDTIRLWNDEKGQHIAHDFDAFGDRGAFLGTYACALLDDGRTYVEALNQSDIDRIMAASKSKDRQGNVVGPWKDWPDRMAQKSALHRLGRRVPVTRNDAAAERLAATLQAERELYGDQAPAGAMRDAEAAQDAQQGAQATQQGPRRPRGLDAVAAAASAAPDADGRVIEGTLVDPDEGAQAAAEAAADVNGLGGDPEADAAHF